MCKILNIWICVKSIVVTQVNISVHRMLWSSHSIPYLLVTHLLMVTDQDIFETINFPQHMKENQACVSSQQEDYWLVHLQQDKASSTHYGGEAHIEDCQHMEGGNCVCAILVLPSRVLPSLQTGLPRMMSVKFKEREEIAYVSFHRCDEVRRDTQKEEEGITHISITRSNAE